MHMETAPELVDQITARKVTPWKGNGTWRRPKENQGVPTRSRCAFWYRLIAGTGTPVLTCKGTKSEIYWLHRGITNV